MKKISIYVDGSNFYFAIKNKFNSKIDFEKFFKKLVGNNDLIAVNYYIAPVEQFSDSEMYAKIKEN